MKCIFLVVPSDLLYLSDQVCEPKFIKRFITYKVISTKGLNKGQCLKMDSNNKFGDSSDGWTLHLSTFDLMKGHEKCNHD